MIETVVFADEAVPPRNEIIFQQTVLGEWCDIRSFDSSENVISYAEQYKVDWPGASVERWTRND